MQYSQGRFSCTRLTALQEVPLPPCCSELPRCAPTGHRQRTPRHRPPGRPVTRGAAALGSRRPTSAGSAGTVRRSTAPAASWEAAAAAGALGPAARAAAAVPWAAADTGSFSFCPGTADVVTPSTAVPALDASFGLTDSPRSRGSPASGFLGLGAEARGDAAAAATPPLAAARADAPFARHPLGGCPAATLLPEDVDSMSQPVWTPVKVVPRCRGSLASQAPCCSLSRPGLSAGRPVRPWQAAPPPAPGGPAVPAMRRSASCTGSRLRVAVDAGRELYPVWGDWPVEF